VESLLRLPVVSFRSGRAFLAALAVASAITASCSAVGSSYAPPDLPSESAARQLLDKIVDLTSRGDFDGLCALGTPECKFVLGQTGVDAAPTAAPRLASVATVPNREKSPGVWAPGGILFSLCGMDGYGRPYRSQMLIFANQQGSGLVAQEPVFWGSLVVGSEIAGLLPSPASPSTWDGCPG
jgi:hypothetical protein